MADGLGALSREREYVVFEPIQTTGNRIEPSHQDKLSDRNRRHDLARKRILGSPHFPCQFANPIFASLGALLDRNSPSRNEVTCVGDGTKSGCSGMSTCE